MPGPGVNKKATEQPVPLDVQSMEGKILEGNRNKQPRARRACPAHRQLEGFRLGSSFQKKSQRTCGVVRGRVAVQTREVRYQTPGY